MPRIPISITKLVTKNHKGQEFLKFLVKIEDKNSSWNKTIECDRKDLERFSEQIIAELGIQTVAELLNISAEQGEILENAYKTDPLCKACKYQKTSKCVPCLLEIKSPIERILYLEMNRAGIYFKMQYGIGRDGHYVDVTNRSYNDPSHNYKDVLTIADFFVNMKWSKICIYTDGHNYHERTEEQALKDRSQDRELQKFGYKVLRFTGKEVRENCNKVIQEIKTFIAKSHE